MSIVVQDGFEALTIANLARKVGVAVGAMYRYFDGKDALVAALQQEAITDLGNHLAERTEAHAVALAKQPPKVQALARVVMSFVAYLDDARSASRRHRLVDAFLSSPSYTLSEGAAREVEAVLEPIFESVEARFDDAVAAGALTPGDAAVRTFVGWAAIHGLDHFRKRDRIVDERRRVSALVPAAFGALLLGWGADPGDVQSALAAVDELAAPA
ncbi:MAG: TetR/AcrR family transcriptional regulator [Myxococcales bacterium]|nr:TetR/AcrR family transcriptional regulator [Myxococcales bacterium]MCB9737493.1 TetR/AcrR family transcriptional regulator [Deltaproteobacteria bacterium]